MFGLVNTKFLEKSSFDAQIKVSYQNSTGCHPVDGQDIFKIKTEKVSKK